MPWNNPIDDPGGALSSVAIVGHRGRMGTMLAARLREVGYLVSGFDMTDDEAIVSETLSHSRIVLLCIPVTALEKALENMAARLRRDQLLMDITSVKVLPMRWMEDHFAGPVIGSHPMFGPEPRPEDMRVALVAGKKATAPDLADAVRLYKALGCRTFWTSAQEHDAGGGPVAVAQLHGQRGFFRDSGQA